MSPRFRFAAVLFLLRLLPPAATSAVAPAPVTFDPEAGLPFVDTFTPRDYRGHQQVLRIVQDAAGRLYFGNLNKVLVYDGAHWTHLAVPEATFIRALEVDADDTLWIGGVDELGYARTDATGARTFVSLKEQLPPEARACGIVGSILNTPHGIVFQTPAWLFRWDGTRFETRRHPVSDLWRLTAVGREAWLTCPKQGWFRVRDAAGELTLDALAPPPEGAEDRVVDAAPTAVPGEFILALENHALWRWDGRSYTAFPTTNDAELRRGQLNVMGRLGDGRIVACSLRTGAWIFHADGRLQAHLDEASGLLDSTVRSVLATRDGHSLWVGLGRGAARVDVRPWLTWFNPANGASRTKLFAAIRFRGELLVPGASGGLLRLIPATAGGAARLVRDPAIQTLVNDVTAAHDALVITGLAGLQELNDRGELTPLPGAPPNATAFMPLPGRPGVWAALNNDQVSLYRREASGWHTRGPIPGLARVRGIVVDADGSWWLGRPAGGVLRATFPDGPEAAPAVESFTAPDGLPPGHGWTRFTADARGPLLTCNLGLLRFDATARRFRSTTEYGAALADGSTYVYGSAPDGRDGLWMILRAANEAEAGNDLRLAFGRAGQLTPLHLPHLTRIDDPGHLLYEPAADGRPEAVWISGHGALVRIDVARWRAAPAEPPTQVRISALTTGSGQRLAVRGDWELPYRDRSLRVQFASPSLAADPGATYETTLVSSSGKEARTDHVAERDYSALGAGRYTLQVRARRSGGAWSAPASLAFTVLPPWWRSAPAFAGYGAAGLIALVAAWRSRVRHLMRRQRELEAAITARTAELAAQNAELVRLRQIEFDEKLEARLAEHKARLEVLRYQLNPHFLFNTLTSICAQIIQAPRTARDTVIRLAEFCRLTLHRPGETEGPTLGDEIEMLRAYLDIEQTRLGDLLEHAIESDPSLARLRLPPFLLLPLVENAVKYGTATSTDRVRIRLTVKRSSADRILIEVANSGAWIPPEASNRTIPSLGIGLDNLRQRLARYFPGAHEFTTEPADGWVVVRLTLAAPLPAPAALP